MVLIIAERLTCWRLVCLRQISVGESVLRKTGLGGRYILVRNIADELRCFIKHVLKVRKYTMCVSIDIKYIVFNINQIYIMILCLIL